MVLSEVTSGVVIEHKILTTTEYERQGSTVIAWCENASGQVCSVCVCDVCVCVCVYVCVSFIIIIIIYYYYYF